jgi:uncharacterized membrane protein YesL
MRVGNESEPWYNAAIMSALKVPWRAVVHLYDESLLMIRANVVWFVGSIPLFLVVLAATWLFVPPTGPEEGPLVWPLVLAAFLLLVIPSPFGVGLYALDAEIVTGDTPDFAVYWKAVRRWWKRALAMFAIGGLVLGALIFNLGFYLSVTQGWLQAVSILWLYVMLYWITLQGYLLPLLITADREVARADAGAPTAAVAPLLTLYKRAAILALANPVMSLIMLVAAAFTMILSFIAMPIYPLIAMAYVSLVGTRALHHLRLKYFPDEAEEAPE